MSNTGRITVCPFYQNHKEKTITCQDTLHIFTKNEILERYMDKHCDDDYYTCKWAKAWEKNLGNPNHRAEAAGKELRKAVAHIGRLESKLKKLEVSNKAFENILRRYKENMQKQDKGIGELTQLLTSQEAKLSYLADITGIKEFSMEEFISWCEKNEFAQEPIIEDDKIVAIRFHSQEQKKGRGE